MGFGGGPSVPKAQPVTPVPQDDDPASLEHKRRAAKEAAGREGMAAHTLKGTSSDTRQGKQQRKSSMIG